MKKQRVFIVVTVLLMAVIAALIWRYGRGSEKANLKDSLPVTTYTLSNGLKLVVVENHRIPAISHTLFVKVGGADDAAGKTGLAHYLEHLTYKGTETVSATEYDRRIAAMGAENNAFTTSDYTAYYVNAPAASLEQVMALESDRMLNVRIGDEEALTERDVIKEERRLRVDSNPASQLAEQMDAVQYLVHPYRVPVIGWAHDIAALTPKDARSFFAKRYVPQAMVLVVAGDVEPKDVRRLAMRYFGPLEKRRMVERHWPTEPEAIAAKQVSLRDVRVKQRQWVRNYLAPSMGVAMGAFASGALAQPHDVVTLELAAEWLGGGKTSVLYRRLVDELGVAVDVRVRYSGEVAGPGVFSVHAIPADGVRVETLEAAVDEALAEALKEGPTPDALKRAKTGYLASVVFAQDGLSDVAMYIGMLHMLGKDEQYFYDLPALIEAAKAEDVKRLSVLVLQRKQSVTGVLLPAEDAALPVVENAAQARMVDDVRAMDLP